MVLPMSGPFASYGKQIEAGAHLGLGWVPQERDIFASLTV
jgi:ABC-type branched-subunit amino acid transport system ATPase component